MSVASQGLFTLVTILHINVERRVYTRNFVSTCRLFVALNRASKLASISAPFLCDFDAISLRFSSIALRFQRHTRPHCDFNVISLSVIRIFSAFSVRF